MMAKAQQPKKIKRGDVRREALVQAAARLFWVQGYSATSLADVAKAADVPIGNLYYYYKSKADLALAVASLFVNQTELLVETVCAETDNSRARLKLFVARLRETQGERIAYGCPIAAACRDLREHAPKASEKAAQSFSILIGFVAQELGRTGLRPSLAMVKARSVVADWQGGIALAHGLQQPTILVETYGRMERALAS
ncbi:MAG: TetR/AcrR family transcriptional regulator [Pseudomonadota bacterium]